MNNIRTIPALAERTSVHTDGIPKRFLISGSENA
jgi:hypothetical protein